MLSTTEIFTFLGLIVESCAGIGYLFLLIVVATTRIPVLRTPFYTIFVITGVAAILNLIATVVQRVINQVLTLGPQYGTVTNCLSYSSHVFTNTHTILKAFQVINRYTALFFPVRHDKIWTARFLWILSITGYFIPAAMFSFFVINQEAQYVDIGGGRLKYAGIRKADQQTAKMLVTAMFCLFVCVTLPLNVKMLLRMKRMWRENTTSYNKQKGYYYYVLAITGSHIIMCVHQIFWLVATIIENSSMNFIAQYSYAYPNAILTFTPPIALVIMSKQVRKGILSFATRRRIGSNSDTQS